MLLRSIHHAYISDISAISADRELSCGAVPVMKKKKKEQPKEWDEPKAKKENTFCYPDPKEWDSVPRREALLSGEKLCFPEITFRFLIGPRDLSIEPEEWICIRAVTESAFVKFP